MNVFASAFELLCSSPLSSRVGEIVKTAAPMPGPSILGEEKLTREEIKNVRKTIKQLQPKTTQEKQVQEVVGRPLTPGQLARYTGIGLGVGLGMGGLRRGLGSIGRGGSIRKTVGHVLGPRDLAGDTATGLAFSALPIIRQQTDIEAAKRGVF